MAKIEVGKTYMTWDGTSVRILAIDLEGDFPVAGVIENKRLDTWNLKGSYSWDKAPHNMDLILEPERKSLWKNWYGDSDNFHTNRESADHHAFPSRTHVFEVIVEDGKPIDVKIHEVKTAR